jgi:hypothetical protein
MEATKLTDDNVTEATDTAPTRRSERSTNRPSIQVRCCAAQELKECGKLKECTTGIKECTETKECKQRRVSLTQLEHCHNIMVKDDSSIKEVL